MMVSACADGFTPRYLTKQIPHPYQGYAKVFASLPEGLDRVAYGVVPLVSYPCGFSGGPFWIFQFVSFK
jgi:hypothetical protein